ncbi:MAG: hypothetical protein QUV04_01575 [Synechococcus sp. WH 8007]|nr:hypothetical protein [Synechococcus sp. WH 8007]
MLTTINTPLYSPGDTLVLTGSNSSSSSGGYYYYYEREDDLSDSVTVTQYYNYSTSFNTEYNEYFDYYSEDGVTVNYVSIGRNDYNFDSAGRQTSSSHENSWADDDGNSAYYAYDTTYTFVNSTSYEWDSSTTISTSDYVSSSGYTSSYTSTTTSEYSYSGQANGSWDFDQMRDITTTDNDGDGIIDETQYSLYTRNDSSNNNSYSDVSVTYDEDGNHTYSNINNSSSTYSSRGNSQSWSYVSSSDYDGDGIINYTSSSSYVYTYDNDWNMTSKSYNSLSKSDWDGDGSANSIYMVKEIGNGSAAKKVEYEWVDDYNSPATLTITKSFDYDGDGTYDSTSGRTMGYTASASYTNIGGHVATYDDTIMA